MTTDIQVPMSLGGMATFWYSLFIQEHLVHVCRRYLFSPRLHLFLLNKSRTNPSTGVQILWVSSMWHVVCISLHCRCRFQLMAWMVFFSAYGQSSPARFASVDVVMVVHHHPMMCRVSRSGSDGCNGSCSVFFHRFWLEIFSGHWMCRMLRRNLLTKICKFLNYEFWSHRLAQKHWFCILNIMRCTTSRF